MGIPPAGAQSAPKVVVLPLQVINESVGADLAPKATDVLAEQFKSIEGLVLVPFKPPAAAPAPPPPPAEEPKKAAPAAADAAFGSGSPSAALSQINRGADMVRHYKFKQGADELAAGISDYEALPAEVDVSKLREAYIQLAVAQMRGGDQAGGIRSLADAIRLAPDQGLSGNYPPVFRRAFESARKHAVTGPKGNLAVKGEGAVQLDGKVIGPAPASAQDLIQGDHFIRVTRSDGTIWGLKAMIGDGDNTVNIPGGAGAPEPTPVPTPVVESGGQLDLSGVAQNRIDDAVLKEVARAAKGAGADFAVFGGIYKSGDSVGLAAHVYNVHTREEVALKAVKFDTDMVSTGMEANKVAVEGEGIVQQSPFPAGETLPAPVAAELAAPVGPKIVVAAPDAGSPDVLVPPRDNKPVGELTDNGVISKPGDEAKSSKTWIWFVAGGAAILIGGAALGYVVYKNQTTPVSGAATVNFQ